MSVCSRDLFAPNFLISDVGSYLHGSHTKSGCYRLVPREDPGNQYRRASHSLCDDAIALGQHDATERTAADILDSHVVQGLTITLILSNAIVMGLETDLQDMFQWHLVEDIFLLLFLAELVFRLSVVGPTEYFKFSNPDVTWNVFDAVIVVIGIINYLLDIFVGNRHTVGRDATLFRIVRLLRLLRVLRIIRIVRFLKQLYLLAYGFIEGTMAVFWVTLLASFMLYICAVILVKVYGHSEGKNEEEHIFFSEHFGNIPRTMCTLFELISAPTLAAYKDILFDNPPLIIFLIIFIIFGSFGINGLLVALINESILEKNQARIEAERIERDLKRKELQHHCEDLFDSIDVNKNRVLPRSELAKSTDQIASLFELLGVNFQHNDLDQMFHIMDYNDTGIIERSEFVQGVLDLGEQIRPMSIMELHYQVSKCGSKVEQSDTKVDNLGKTLETCDTKLDQVTRTIESLDLGSAELLSKYREHVSQVQVQHLQQQRQPHHQQQQQPQQQQPQQQKQQSRRRTSPKEQLQRQILRFHTTGLLTIPRGRLHDVFANSPSTSSQQPMISDARQTECIQEDNRHDRSPAPGVEALGSRELRRALSEQVNRIDKVQCCIGDALEAGASSMHPDGVLPAAAGELIQLADALVHLQGSCSTTMKAVLEVRHQDWTGMSHRQMPMHDPGSGLTDNCKMGPARHSSF